MGVVASDSFTGTDDTNVQTYSANWTRHEDLTTNAKIISNRVKGTVNNLTCQYWWNANSPSSADYDVATDLYFATKDGGAGPAGRMVTTDPSCYWCRYNYNANLQLYKISSTGTSTQLGSNVATGYGAGDTKRATLKMSGTTIEAWMDGSSSADISVTDSTITDAGYAGFRLSASATTTDTEDIHVDYWEFSEADVAGQPYRKRLGGVRFAAHNAGVW